MAIIPLYKEKGHNPEAADWFWVKHKLNVKAGEDEGKFINPCFFVNNI